jgi:SAM-dependent methyltransferase
LQGLPPGARILDAGSGFTFFPYLLADELAAHVTCVDVADLGGLFDASPYRDRSVEFASGDLGALPFDDATFDAVVCVSVLEHMDMPDVVVAEFRRVLKPGGRLVLTMDVSLDGRAQISVPGAERLVGDLAASFEPVAAPQLTTQSLTADGVLTTRTLTQPERQRLPWSHPRLYGAYARLRARKLPVPRTLDLAVYSATYTRR